MEQAASLIHSRSEGWDVLRSKLINILGTDNCEDLLDEFESQLKSMPSGKLPHYSLVCYLALIILYPPDELEILALNIKERKSYKMMIVGLRIFLSSGSKNLKYEVELPTHKYDNKYEYVDYLSGFIPDYERKLRAFLDLFDFINRIDEQIFYDLLALDHDNLIYLSILLNGRINLNNTELIPFLKSEDLLKANGAFFYMTNNFKHLIERIQHNESSENKKKVEQQIAVITEMLTTIPEERKVHLSLNYILIERYYPDIFFHILAATSIDTVVNELKDKAWDNLYQLLKLKKLFDIRLETEIQKIFVHHFIWWVQEKATPLIWQECQSTVVHIIEMLSPQLQRHIFQELEKLKQALNVSSFDKEIRQTIFQKEETKAQVISDCLIKSTF